MLEQFPLAAKHKDRKKIALVLPQLDKLSLFIHIVKQIPPSQMDILVKKSNDNDAAAIKKFGVAQYKIRYNVWNCAEYAALFGDAFDLHFSDYGKVRLISIFHSMELALSFAKPYIAKADLIFSHLSIWVQ